MDTKGNPVFDSRDRIPEPKEISRYCSSLVVVVSRRVEWNNQDKKTVIELQLAHFSVKEYLISDRLDKDIAQSFQEATAKAMIGTVCLAYLLHLNQSIGIKEIRETFPLAQYSARYWMSHAAVAEGKDKILQGFITKFLCYRKGSYRNCYNLYRPDNTWDNEPTDTEEEPASALYYASFGGLVNAAKYLLSQGADVNVKAEVYDTALQTASA